MSTTSTKSIRVNAPPVANFTYSVDHNLKTYTVDSSTTTDDNLSGLSYKWLDGQKNVLLETTSQVSTLDIPSRGINEITLIVTDSDGLQTSTAQEIRLNTSPIADAIVTPLIGDFPHTVNFDASYSLDDDGIASYEWRLNDSQVISSNATGSIVISEAAMSKLTLTVIDTNGVSNTKDYFVTTKTNPDPVANFNFEKEFDYNHSLVKFDAITSSDDKEIVSYNYNFGDGNNITTNNYKVNHTYSTAGTFQVSLTITDDQQATNTIIKEITILENIAPLAQFNSDKSNGEYPLTVIFDASATTDNEKEFLTYNWSIDGINLNSSEKVQDYTFTQAGSFGVTLTVTDRQGLTSTATGTIVVTDPNSTDLTYPIVTTNFENGKISNQTTELSFALFDQEGINYNSLRVFNNGIQISDNNLDVNESTGILRVLFDTNLSLTTDQREVFTIKVADINGNYASKAYFYDVVNELEVDSKGPLVNFDPAGGNTQVLTNTIMVYMYDKAGIDYSSVSITLNGDLLSTYSTDTNIGKIELPVTLAEDAINKLIVTVSDNNSNMSATSMALDTRSSDGEVIASGPQIETTTIGIFHSCAKTDSGSVKCWGYNAYGQLGQNNTNNIGDNETPATIGTIDLGGNVSSVGSGFYHTCALREDKKVICWGWSNTGQVGIGTNQAIGDNEPITQTVPLNGDIEDLYVGAYTNCAKRSDGNIYCWGSNTLGQTGSGNGGYIGSHPSRMPLDFGQVDIGTNVITDIKIGHENACFLFDDKNAKCLGANSYGIIDYPGTYTGGATTFANVATIDFTEDIKQIDVGDDHACALFTNNKIKCWGKNNRGQLGQGHTTDVNISQVETLPYVDVGEDVASITVINDVTCVQTLTNKYKCWGSNGNGELGIASTSPIGDDELPSSIGFLNFGEEIVDFSHSGAHGCAKVQSGGLYCFGLNNFGQLGYGNGQKIGDNELPVTAGTIDLGFSSGGSGVLAKVTVDPNVGQSPLMVNFDATDSTSINGTIAGYSFDFGDGNTTSEPTGIISHTYQNPGVYILTLTVTDSTGATEERKDAITVSSDAINPIAVIGTSSDYTNSGVAVTLNSNKSYDPRSLISEYEWNFGDGQILTTSNTTVNHTYNTAGTYTVTLKVKSSDNRESELSEYIIVVNGSNEAPIANFTCNVNSYTIDCNASDSVDYDGVIKSYLWTLGDGSKSAGQTLTHTFSQDSDGVFDVQLTVFDDENLSHMTTKTFTFDMTSPSLNSNLTSNLSLQENKFDFNVIVTDDSNTITEIFVNNALFLTTQDKNIDTYVVLPDGNNTIKVISRDIAGNIASPIEVSNISVGDSSPVINYTPVADVLTNNETYTLDFSIQDDGDTKTSVIVNNQVVQTDLTDKNISIQITLEEGSNYIEIQTVDDKNQQATPVTITNIILDKISPTLISLNPEDATKVFGSKTLKISGKANEPLSKVEINGQEASIDGDKFSFDLVNPTEGDFTYSLTLFDMANNQTNYTKGYEILYHLLYKELISLVQVGDELKVIGVPGATRYPNQEVKISGGFFNNETITSNADGSFEAIISFSNSITVSAYNDEWDFKDEYQIGYNANTTLSGIVKDVDDNPLLGATVTIASSGQSAVTNISGVFSIANPVTGDQDVLIDATTVTTDGTKKFSKSNVNVSIGHKQLNTLQRVIYLAPLLIDGTETIVDPDQSVTVSKDGVEIDIPAGVANFPSGTQVDVNGEMKNIINISRIPLEKTSLPAFESARPDKVYALEPSGVEFSEPVKLTLPNDHEFEVGTELVIMSKNSKTGFWELDGVAEVKTANSIETLDGQGITHFSEVYAAPYGLDIAKYGQKERPGVNGQNGALATKVDLPSYKVFGSDLTPSLYYKSSWAKPNAIISAVLNLPKQKVSRVNKQWVAGTRVKTEFDVWNVPNKVTSTFKINEYESPELSFNVQDAPDKAVISYALDLDFLTEGIYPTKADYKIEYKNFVVVAPKKNLQNINAFGIRTDYSDEELQYGGQLSQVSFSNIFPEPMQDLYFHQSKTNSSIGSGWKLGLTQKIVNPDQDRLMLEEADGSVTSYIIDNSIETIAYNEDGIKNATLNNSENLNYISNENIVFSVSKALNNGIQSYEETEERVINNYSLTFSSNLAWWTHKKTKYRQSFPKGGKHFEHFFTCERGEYSIDAPKVISDIHIINGELIYLDRQGALFKNTNSQDQLLAGEFKSVESYTIDKHRYRPSLSSFCESNYLTTCSNTDRQPGYSQFNRNHLTYGASGTDANWLPEQYRCGSVRNLNSGSIPIKGFNNGELANSNFNTPDAFAPSKSEGNIFYIADTGNNVIRKISLGSNISTTIAGNRQTTDLIDSPNNVDATSIAIHHPRGVTTDQIGNVYFSSENGLIRKVSPSGKVINVAGYNQQAQAIETNSLDKVSFFKPEGLAFDDVNNFLYVADTGNNRIVRLDLNQGISKQIAGTTTCQSGEESVKEGHPALEVSLCAPKKIGLDQDNNLLVLDSANKRVRKISFNNNPSGLIGFKSVNPDNSLVIKQLDGSFERILRDGSKMIFDAQGKQILTEDTVGNITTYGYNQDRLTSITDVAGGVSTLSYSGNLLSSFTDPAGRATQFNYSGNELISVNFPDGSNKDFSYDPEGKMTSETDKVGNLAQYEYNQWKRLERVIRPDGTEITTSASITDTLMNDFTGGNLGELKNFNNKPVEEGGNELADTYTNAKGVETKMVKDMSGFVQSITDEKDRVTKIERDLEARPIRIEKYNGEVSEFEYNELGDLVYKFDSETGLGQSFVYNNKGLLLSSSVSKNNNLLSTVSKTYYPSGLTNTETDQNGNTTTNEYYPNGLLKSVTNQAGEQSSFEYDSYGNLSKRISPNGESTSYTRNDAGNIISKVSANGLVTDYTFDDFNRLTSVATGISSSNPTGHITSYSYTLNGDLALIVDPEGNQTTFEYNSLNELIRKTTHLGQVTELAYDATGNLNYQRDPNGNVTTFTYNDSNELINKVLADNSYAMSYDNDGNMTSLSDNDSSFNFSYLKKGSDYLVQSVDASGADMPSYSLGYEYDDFANRTKMTTPVGAFDYTYDQGNRLTSLTNHKGENFSVNYDSSDRIVSMSRPGSTTSYSFDSNSFLTGINHKKSSNSNINQMIYTRDAVGNRTSIITSRGIENYGYDNENQLVSANNSEIGLNETFVYDSLGNRVSDNNGLSVYDAKKSRLLEDYKYLYTYDSNGNQISKTEKGLTGNFTQYEYSSENQLVKASKYVSNSLTMEANYKYDALGRRMQKIVSYPNDPTKSFVRKYAYDGEEILISYDESNNILATYTQSTLRTDDTLAVDVTTVGKANKIAKEAGSFMFLKDALGSITDITDDSGNLIEHIAYSSFGKISKVTDATGADKISDRYFSIPYSYTNREYDSETDLYHYRARAYDASIGRFLQEDPHPGFVKESKTLITKYIYTANNPLKYTDPSGKIFFTGALIISTVLSFTATTSAAIAISAASVAFFSVLAVGEARNNYNTEKYINSDGFSGDFSDAVFSGVLGGLGGFYTSQLINSSTTINGLSPILRNAVSASLVNAGASAAATAGFYLSRSARNDVDPSSNPFADILSSAALSGALSFGVSFIGNVELAGKVIAISHGTTFQILYTNGADVKPRENSND